MARAGCVSPPGHYARQRVVGAEHGRAGSDAPELDQLDLSMPSSQTGPRERPYSRSKPGMTAADRDHSRGSRSTSRRGRWGSSPGRARRGADHGAVIFANRSSESGEAGGVTALGPWATQASEVTASPGEATERPAAVPVARSRPSGVGIRRVLQISWKGFGTTDLVEPTLDGV
jgi:hypothetical protein